MSNYCVEIGWRIKEWGYRGGGEGRPGAGVHLLASKGIWGSAVSFPIGAWGGAPEAFTFFASNPAKNQCIRSAVNF